MQDAPAHVGDEGAVVRRHQHRRAGGVDVPEEIHDLERQVRVEVARRLVGQDDLRLVDERAGDRDALLLTARQLRRVGQRAMLEADPLEHLIRAPPLLVDGHAEHAHDERHVVEDRLGRDELEVLEHDAERPPVGLHLGGRELGQFAPPHDQPALGRHLLAQQQPEERRLPRATRAGEEDELALVDRERQAVEGRDVGAVDLGDVVEFDHGGCTAARDSAPPRS
jgi:hypothetical protein